MENKDYEMLIEYSEMTAFNFKSEEFKEVLRDVQECKKAFNFVEKIIEGIAKGFVQETFI